MKPSEFVRKGWTRKAYARNEKRLDVPVEDSTAVTWCSLGAINASFGPDVVEAGEFKLFVEESIGRILTIWNDEDERTQDEVIEVLETAESRYEGVWTRLVYYLAT